MIYQFTCDYAQPRYWIDENVGMAELVRRAEIENYEPSGQWKVGEPKLGCVNFRLVYRKVASNTNEVTLIAAILPPCNFVGESINVLIQWEFLPSPYHSWIKYFDESNKLFLMSLFNSFTLNYILRQKVSANLSMYLLSQLPIPRLPTTHPISQALVPLAARLTCIEERFAPMWEELALHHVDSMASQWSPDCAAVDSIERAQLRAEIDVHVADLYGLSELDFACILSTFPLLDRDQPALPGEPKSFITRDLALLALFTLRGKIPPDNVISFFAEAGADIRHQTGAILDLRKRVRVAQQEFGAVAYQPSGHERGDGEMEAEEQDESDFEEEE